MPPFVSRVALSVSVLLASVLLHLGMLGVIVLAERRGATTAETDIIEVELVQPPQTEPPPKAELQKPETPKPESLKPEPSKPDSSKPESAKPEPPKQADQQPKPAVPPAPQPAPKPSEPPSAQTAPAASQETEPAPDERPEKPEGPSGGPPSESQAKLAAAEIAAFRAQVQKCWTLPVGIPDAMKLETVLRVRFARNGTLAADPELLKANASAGGPILVGIAMKAMRECAPYRSLPASKYDEWKVLDLRFAATGLAALGSSRR